MAITPLPPTPADITPGWVTEVLHQHGSLLESGTVESISATPVGEGVGMLSEIEFLALSYAGEPGPDAPSTVVVKFPTQNDQNKAVAHQFNVYTREVRYFAELDPHSDADGPKVFLSHQDDDGHFVIILEDLSDYRTGDQIVGATLAETEAAVDALARLHASFWDKMDEDRYDWLPRSANSENATNMLGGATAGWDPMVEIFGDHIPQWLRDVKDAYLATVPSLQEQLDQAPRTLLHGDFRMDNLFFAQEPHHYPMTFVDWQGPIRGRGIHDVAYLLCQSTQLEVRRANEKAIIQRYVDALERHGVTGYTFDDAWSDYRVAVLYLWVYAATIAGTLDATNERGNAWMVEMIKRNVAAIEDLELLELLQS